METANILKIDISDYKTDDLSVISSYTHNTWQERDIQEIKQDTFIGKAGEYAVEQYIKTINNYNCLSYDNIRQDRYLKHAPFDMLFFKNDNKYVNNIIDKINKEISNGGYGHISSDLKDEAFKKGIYFVEVKTTRKAERHSNRASFFCDDFLEYPKYKRTDYDSKIYSLDSYISYYENTYRKKISLTYLLRKEYENMRHIYIRAYYDNNNVYLVSWINRYRFIQHVTLKRMIKKNKSEAAIYLATSLYNGFNIDYLKSLKFNA